MERRAPGSGEAHLPLPGAGRRNVQLLAEATSWRCWCATSPAAEGFCHDHSFYPRSTACSSSTSSPSPRRAEQEIRPPHPARVYRGSSFAKNAKNGSDCGRLVFPSAPAGEEGSRPAAPRHRPGPAAARRPRARACGLHRAAQPAAWPVTAQAGMTRVRSQPMPLGRDAAARGVEIRMLGRADGGRAGCSACSAPGADHADGVGEPHPLVLGGEDKGRVQPPGHAQAVVGGGSKGIGLLAPLRAAPGRAPGSWRACRPCAGRCPPDRRPRSGVGRRGSPG